LHIQGTCPPPLFRESISWIISPFKFWTATIFLHAHLRVVYYKCLKFHKNPISGLGGVALTRYMDGQTGWFLYTPPNFVCRGYNKLRMFKILLSVPFSFLKPNFFTDTSVYWTYSVEINMFIWHCILALVMEIIFKPIHTHKSHIRTECVRVVMSNKIH
jgi:hypothetical protein